MSLNVIDSDNLRRINKKNMSSVPKDTSEQLSRAGIVADFGIDIEQDLIQSITAGSKFEAFGKTVTGKDALSVSIKVDLLGIKDFLITCHERYLSDDYKKDFGWIDQIAEIKDPKLNAELNNKLLENIKNKNFEKTWIAVPELVNWEDVSGFAYKNENSINKKDDIFFSDFVETLDKAEKENPTLETLKNNEVYCFSTSSDELKHCWKIYNCIYCEISDKEKKKTYLLSNGKWYEIEKDFSEEVNKDYEELRKAGSTITLPKYNHKNENEYNKEITKDNGDLCCMDRKNISHGGGHSKIEFCDIFTKDKKIIHVKHYAGSSVLSHLFAQGVVSGELFLADKKFREKVNTELSDSHKLTDITNKPKAEDYEVIFAVISSSKKELELPFFSKVSLRNAKRRLDTFGYKVSLQKIEAGTD